MRHAETSMLNTNTIGKIIDGKMIRCVHLPIACLHFS